MKERGSQAPARIVAIGGMSGCGKTTLARTLARTWAQQPGEAAAVIALDWYYHPLPHLSAEERAIRNFDHPDALDWELLETHLASLRAGASVEAPVYLFDQHTRAPQTIPVPATGCLIVEGILALHQPSIRRLADVKVFVETARDECLNRRILRDTTERGRTHASVLNQYAATVWPMARQYVLPTRDHADLTVSGEQPVEAACALITARLGEP